MKRAAIVVLLVLPMVSAAAVRMHQSDRDTRIARYWDATRQATTPAELAEHDTLRRAAAALGPEAAAVAEGLHRIRAYELTLDRSDGLGAQRVLEVAARETRDWAWAQLAYALALTRGPGLRVRSGGTADDYFVDRRSVAASRAPAALRRALRLDPGLRTAAHEMAGLAFDLNDPALLAEAYVAIADLPGPREPEDLLLRSQLAERMNHYADAAALADSAIAAGGDPALALYRKAVAMLTDPRTASHRYAELVYRRSLQRLSDEAAQAQYRDLALITTETERDEWQRARSAGERAAWLIGFWEIRAAMGGAAVHERMAAHYRRLHVARTELPALMGLNGIDLDVLAQDDPRAYGLSSAGLMLVRHGDADRINRLLWCTTAIDTIPASIRPSIAECRHVFRQNALYVRSGPAQARLARRIAARRGVPGDHYDVPFEEDLLVARELYAFRGDSGTTEVVAAIAVPAVSAPMTGGGITLDAELILIDPAQRVVERAASRSRFPPERAAGDLLLVRSLPSVIRGTSEYRVVVSDAGRRTGRVSQGRIAVPDFTGTDLRLSDVVIAPARATPSWARGDVALALTPARSYVPGETVALYYEAYGLTEAASYRTDLVFTPRPDGAFEHLEELLGNPEVALRLTFAGQAGVPHPVHGVQVLRTLELDAIEPGSYDLTVSVTDADGRVATTTRTIVIDVLRDR